MIIPPLLFYTYSPYSMEGTCLNNGKLNDAFFNTYKSAIAQSINTKLNYNPTKFSNDAICSTCNKFSTLFLTNINDNLSNPIGNLTYKQTYYKLEQIKNIYNRPGIYLLNIYDESQFIYGTLIINSKDQYYSSVADINGNLTDSIYKQKIIYANGYYDYLNFPLIPNIQNEITIEIINGIGKTIIPEDPTGLYEPKFINNTIDELVPTAYLKPPFSTFKNTDLQMEEYNLSSAMYLDKSLNVNVGEFNQLSIINKNVFNDNLDDGLFFQMFSVSNISPLIDSGNILALSFAHNYETGSIGYISTPRLRLPIIIIYADNDFEYLNFNPDPSKFYTAVVEINQDTSRTIYLPSKPTNNIPVVISYPENFILPDKIIWNKFYSKPGSNSSVFDNSQIHQNITIYADLYDSYDPISGNFGNVIGIITSFKYIYTNNNQTYTVTLTYTSFHNNEYLTSIGIYINGLDKNGGLSPVVNLNKTIIASSDGYTFNSYVTKINAFKKFTFTEIGYIKQ
jgi:hypothetical protein